MSDKNIIIKELECNLKEMSLLKMGSFLREKYGIIGDKEEAFKDWHIFKIKELEKTTEDVFKTTIEYDLDNMQPMMAYHILNRYHDIKINWTQEEVDGVMYTFVGEGDVSKDSYLERFRPDEIEEMKQWYINMLKKAEGLIKPKEKK